MSKTTAFRVTKDNFNKPAVTKERQHFFPYDDCTKLIGVDKVQMDYAFYQPNRRNWYCDFAYLTLTEAREIATYALKRGLIHKLPSALTLQSVVSAA